MKRNRRARKYLEKFTEITRLRDTAIEESYINIREN